MATYQIKISKMHKVNQTKTVFPKLRFGTSQLDEPSCKTYCYDDAQVMDIPRSAGSYEGQRQVVLGRHLAIVATAQTKLNIGPTTGSSNDLHFKLVCA